MNFFKNRFRAAALLFLVTFACLVSAHAVDIRRAGRDTQFTYNGVTYTFRAQINSSPNGVYGSASAKSSSPLQAGNLGILAYVYDISGKIVQTSDIIYNPNHHSTALSATDAITAPGTYYCGAVIFVYDPSIGDYIRRYANSDAELLEVSTASAPAFPSKSLDSLKRRHREWLEELEAEREAEIAEQARQAIEQMFPDAAAKRELERIAREKAEIEAEIAEHARQATRQLHS